MALKEILGNIEEARLLSEQNSSARIVAVVSGSEADKSAWQKRLEKISPYIFNRDGSTCVLSLQERIGPKTREGNFLGTLLAYHRIKKEARKAGINYRDLVTLVGMLFGHGERMSPVTQNKGCRKPAIEVTPANIEIGKDKQAFTAIEEALLYFTPVVRYLEKRGFKGILDKWGDETEISSIDLTGRAESGDSLAEYDLIKFVSVVKITDKLAKQKDWVVFDEEKNIVAQLSRNDKDSLMEQLKALGITPDSNGDFYAGVSLGPVAVSYDLLDIALDVFREAIKKEGVYFDFDPYFLMALVMEGKKTGEWKELARTDAGLKDLTGMVPDFFEKVQEVKTKFSRTYGRRVNARIFDFGKEVYWADIGQHNAMRQKFLLLNDKGPKGVIARRIASLPERRDKCDNIVVNSEISPDVTVKDSVVVNSRITGRGFVKRSVMIDSVLCDVEMTDAFAVRSVRSGKMVLKKESGLYDSLGTGDLVLEEGMRHVTLLTEKGPVDMEVSEETDLRDKDNTYNKPIFGNAVSFQEAYDEMFGVSMEELQKRRSKVLEEMKDR